MEALPERKTGFFGQPLNQPQDDKAPDGKAAAKSTVSKDNASAQKEGGSGFSLSQKSSNNEDDQNSDEVQSQTQYDGGDADKETSSQKKARKQKKADEEKAQQEKNKELKDKFGDALIFPGVTCGFNKYAPAKEQLETNCQSKQDKVRKVALQVTGATCFTAFGGRKFVHRMVAHVVAHRKNQEDGIHIFELQASP